MAKVEEIVSANQAETALAEGLKQVGIGNVFPVAITNHNGQVMVGVVEPDPAGGDWEKDKGAISIPIGFWNAPNLDKNKRKIFALAEGVSDFDALEKLGFDPNQGIRHFDLNFTHSLFSQIEICTDMGYRSRLDPNTRTRSQLAARLITDFQAEFPGWQVEPLDLSNPPTAA